MKNLGYLTDAYFLEEAKEIIEYPDYTFVRSPNQPNFYYGNYLLLNEAPTNTDKEKLEKIFKNSFVDEQIKHFTFCWSGEDTNGIQPFLEAGYELEELTVLAAHKEDLINLEKKNEEISIRAFESKKDWEEWIDFECSEKPDGFSVDGFRTFVEGRRAVYYRLKEKGCGNFYGAYINDQLVASAGFFYQGSIGRFQSVKTKTDYRRRGICKTLVHFICKTGFQKLDALVIAADKGYHALELYKKLGFKPTASQTSVYWHEN